VFVPISLTQSPIEAEKFIIVLRTSENVQAFPLEGWFTTNIVQLAKKFVTKTVKLDASFTPGSFHIKITKMLREYNSSENLNLVGGFQDNKNQLQLLFYKTDRPETTPIEIFTENYQPGPDVSPDDKRLEIEGLIN